MKLSTKIMIGLAAAAPLFAIAPGYVNKRRKEAFLYHNFAHRGLHTEDKSVPENSVSAFSAAVEQGYGIELDVQLSRDGQVVVFHDDTLNRMTGANGRVDDRSYAELCELCLADSEERIPLFSDVLACVGGRTPIICELKRGRNNKELCRKTLELIDYYDGDICIESFDPTIVAWFRFHAPDIIRGQLAAPPEEYKDAAKPPLAFAMGNGLMNCVGRPHFIAYKIGPKPFPVRMAEWMGAMKVAWTSHSQENEINNHAVIFEFYKPQTKYK